MWPFKRKARPITWPPGWSPEEIAEQTARREAIERQTKPVLDPYFADFDRLAALYKARKDNDKAHRTAMQACQKWVGKMPLIHEAWTIAHCQTTGEACTYPQFVPATYLLRMYEERNDYAAAIGLCESLVAWGFQNDCATRVPRLEKRAAKAAAAQ